MKSATRKRRGNRVIPSAFTTGARSRSAQFGSLSHLESIRTVLGCQDEDHSSPIQDGGIANKWLWCPLNPRHVPESHAGTIERSRHCIA